MVSLIPVGELARTQSGGTPSKNKPEYWQGNIPWVSPKDFSNSTLRHPKDYITPEAVENSAVSLVPAGTILVVARSGILAHSFPVALTEKPVTFNQDVKALLPDRRRLSPSYLFHFLRSLEQAVVHHGVKRGATVHSLRSKFLELTLIPLPSLAEQGLIVDILDRAAGIERLHRQALDRAHQMNTSLLAAMFDQK